MTPDYLLRLAWLSLACLGIVHLSVAAAVAAGSRMAVRRSSRMTARGGARFLLALRLAPAAVSLGVVVLLCVPAFLLHEPAGTAERAGMVCLVAALAGSLLWLASIAQAVRAARSSARYLRDCLRRGSTVRLNGEDGPVCVLGPGSPSMVLAGVARPRLLVSDETLRALTGDQLTAALRHERAHRDSRDNLKRLLLVLAPGVLPGWSGLESLERAWARLAEWAADDQAVAGDSQVSVSLAAALLRVARMGRPNPRWLVTSPITGGEDLSARIDRLLAPSVPARPDSPGFGWALFAAAASLSAAAALGVDSSRFVHSLLELLMQ